VLETALTRRHISACIITVTLLERTETLQQITFLGIPQPPVGRRDLE
jgi:hypothetical protein